MSRPAEVVDTKSRVLIVHPQRLMRQALASLVEEIDDMVVIGDVETPEEAVRAARDHAPDVVVVDGDVPDDLSIDLVGELKAAVPGGRVLLLAERVVQSRVEGALCAGADGYTLKQISSSEFAESMRRVARGETMLHPSAAAALVRSLATLSSTDLDTADPMLTAREKEILRLVALGLQNKQIARRLEIGVDTVKTHVSRILHKLGVKSRTEAVVLALKEGLVA